MKPVDAGHPDLQSQIDLANERSRMDTGAVGAWVVNSVLVQNSGRRALVEERQLALS